MPDTTLQVSSTQTTLQLAAGLALSIAATPTVLSVTQGGQTLQLPVSRSSITVAAGPTLQLPVVQTTLQVSAPGLPGPAGQNGADGQQQFYVGGSQPAPAALPILWFKPSDAPNAQAGDYDVELL